MNFSNPSFFLLLLTISLLSACGQDDNGGQDLEPLLKAQLSNVLDNEIIPLHLNFEAECIELESIAAEFALAPSIEQLRVLKNQWENTALSWKRCEVYDIGDINNSFIHFRIHRWPTNIEFIEEAIDTDETINFDYVSSKGSSSIGLAAIEYLLFELDENLTVERFEQSEKRLNYLLAMTQYLLDQATTLKALWNSYGPVFSEALQNAIDGGQNELGNALIAFLEESNKLRLEKPLGEADGGVILVEVLEAPYSDISKAMLENAFESFKKMYTGDFSVTSDSTGFDDYLIALGYESLNESIVAAIANCDQKIEALDGQEFVATLTEAPEKMIALRDAFKELVILIKVDMASAINLLVTVNDTDGD